MQAVFTLYRLLLLYTGCCYCIQGVITVYRLLLPYTGYCYCVQTVVTAQGREKAITVVLSSLHSCLLLRNSFEIKQSTLIRNKISNYESFCLSTLIALAG
jgi:hypothetical protein